MHSRMTQVFMASLKLVITPTVVERNPLQIENADSTSLPAKRISTLSDKISLKGEAMIMASGTNK